MSFQHPEYLLFFAGIPLLLMAFTFYQRWKDKTAAGIGDPALVQQLISNYSSKKFLLKFILICTAFSLAVIGLANPRKNSGNNNVKRNGIDVMIALDVSKSMLAQDIKPSRLERARQLISKLIDKLPDDRVGLVVFAGRAYLQMPLTGDHAAAKMYLTAAGPQMVPAQGTVIGDALKMCFAGFTATEKKYRAIILISDGEDHDESAEKTAKQLAQEAVMVNSIGIGSPEGAVITDALTGELKKDAQGNTVITKLNETGLKKIAALTGGIYQLYGNTDETVNAVEAQLKTIGQRSITETSLASYTNYFPWFIGTALIVLLLELFLSEKRKTTGSSNSNATPKSAFTIWLVLIPAAAISQNNTTLIQKGNEAYRQKKYAEAATLYSKATEQNTNDGTALYNLGNALYKKGSKDEALKAYDDAIAATKNNTDKAAAWYNKGVVLQNNGKLKECIEAYKNALKLNPADEEARLNLQKALQQLQQQQKENENQQKKNEKKPKTPAPPKPQPGKMSKKEAEEKLKALMQQEKNLQDKLKKVDASTTDKPEKDW